MKNLKKLSRGEMEKINGGTLGYWACCNSVGDCSTSVYGDSDLLVCGRGYSLQACSPAT